MFHKFLTYPPVANYYSLRKIVRDLFVKNSIGVNDFNESLERRFGYKNMLFFNSGRAALFFVLQVLSKESKKKNVLIPEYTCPSIVDAILQAGLKPVVIKLKENSLCYDLKDLNDHIDLDTLAIVVVHLFGISQDVAAIKSLTGNKGVFVVEDCAQSLGSKHNNNYVGKIGDAAIFSFGVGKNITTFGGGGLIINSQIVKEKANLHYSDIKEEQQARMKLLLLIVGYFFAIKPFFWTFIALLKTSGQEQKDKTTIQILKLSDKKKRIGAWMLKNAYEINKEKRKQNAIYLSENISLKSFVSKDQIVDNDLNIIRFPVSFKGNAKLIGYPYKQRVGEYFGAESPEYVSFIGTLPVHYYCHQNLYAKYSKYA